ncbi:MAG: efflux RND transporter periplasmic adaptor subunit [Planctomycetes bacterium]|nr:efflux RND transporter periplasmic adaptor subunit [Planctomycetota bacterium]
MFANKFLKWLPIVIIGIFVLYLVSSQFQVIENDNLELKRTIKAKFKNVYAIALKRSDIHDYIWVQGRAKPLKTLKIKSEINKKITHINVRLGQWIQKGDLIFCLNEEDAVADYSNAQAALMNAQANYDYAVGDYDNKKKLSEDGYNEITEDVLKLSEKSKKTTLAFKLQAQAILQNAESALRKTVFIAPFSGIITQLNFQTENELVNANTVIAEIADLSKLNFIASIAVEDVTYLSIGTKVSTLDIGHKTLDEKGVITGISANASNSGTYKIEIEFDNSNMKVPVLANKKIDVAKLDKYSTALKMLNLQPSFPQGQLITLNPDMIPGNIVARTRLPKGIVKNAFNVPANSIIRKDGANFICEIQRIIHPLYTFGAADDVLIEKTNFIPVQVYKYIDDNAIIYSKYLSDDIFIAIGGHKSLNPGESVIIKSLTSKIE